MTEVRILHVIKGLGRGGAERLLVSTTASHRAPYRFAVVYFLPWKNQLVKDLEHQGCEVYCLPARNVGMMLLKLPALCRLIRTGGFGLIHAHLPWSGIVARLAGSITKVKVVYTEHNLISRYKPITRMANFLTFRLHSATIAVSQKAEEDLRQVYHFQGKIRVIPNGVDFRRLPSATIDGPRLRAEFGLPSGAFVIGIVAVFTRQKRLDRWITICRELMEIPGAFFVMVGDGILRKQIEESAADLTATGRLLFTGLSDQPEQWMACMDVFLMTSDWEGLPVALLEAMGIGCVPVATAVGGVPSLIQNGTSGFLFQPEDTALAINQVRILFQDPARRTAIANQAREIVASGFGIQRMTMALEEVYDEVLGRTPKLPAANYPETKN